MNHLFLTSKWRENDTRKCRLEESHMSPSVVATSATLPELAAVIRAAVLVTTVTSVFPVPILSTAVAVPVCVKRWIPRVQVVAVRQAIQRRNPVSTQTCLPFQSLKIAASNSMGGVIQTLFHYLVR